MYSSQIKRQLTDMPRYPRTPGFQINVGAWSKPQAKGTASPSTLSMLANRGTKPQISTLETSKLETSSSENVSLKNVEFVNASLVWPFWATVFIASFMLYVHSSKAEEFDLKTIARNFISINTPADLIILANCDGVKLLFCFFT